MYFSDKTRFSRYSDRALWFALSDLANEFAMRRDHIRKDWILSTFERDLTHGEFVYWHCGKQTVSNPEEIPF